MMKTATYLGRPKDKWKGDARWYKLSKPLMYKPWRGAEKQYWEYVIISGVHALYGPETCIFPADAEGSIKDLRELPGSFRGAVDHVAALTNAGYRIIEEKS